MIAEGGDDLVTLALALLKRGASAGQILEAMGDGGQTEQPRKLGRPRKGSAEPEEGPQKRKRPVTHAHVLAALRDAPGPLTCAQLTERLPSLTNPAAQRHMDRAIELGNVIRISKEKPFTYALSKAGRKSASAVGDPGAIAPAAKGDLPSGGLSHAQILATIGRLGSATMTTIRLAHPHASRTAIYQHVTRGVTDGELTRSGQKNLAIYSLKAGGKTFAPRTSGPKTGTRREAIVAALRKAGRPLTGREIWGTYFPDMRIGTVEQHILQGMHRHELIRHGKTKPFRYTAPPLKETRPNSLPKGVAKGTLSGDRFIAELRKVTSGPIPSREIYKLFPDVLPHSVDTTLANYVKAGLVWRIGKKRPYTYQAKAPEASAPVVKSGGHANGTPTATA